MADLGHDAAFVEEAAALRPRLERCARLLYPDVDGDRARAVRAVDQALARTYATAADTDRTIAAFRALLRTPKRRSPSRRLRGERVELRDVADSHRAGLADDLAALGPTARAVVVLTVVGGLGPADLGRIVGVPSGRVTEVFSDAAARLARTDPRRTEQRELARQLDRLAGPTDPTGTALAGVGDLDRGRRLARRALVRRGLLAVATIVAVALVAGFVVRGTVASDVAEAPAPTPAASSWGSYRCDTSRLDCQMIRTARWRSRMADSIVRHLDPQRAYFSAMTFDLRDDRASDAFWDGEDGALDITVSRPGDGSTEIYLQIATSRAAADRCGRRTGHRCQTIAFMNGNRYRIAGASTGSGGVEVQYAADVNQVITVVARNTSRQGWKLDIDTGELVQLVSDPRLRLPRR
jgi:DNA-directed RNA polymerase specialized sigma24 family protein